MIKMHTSSNPSKNRWVKAQAGVSHITMVGSFHLSYEHFYIQRRPCEAHQVNYYGPILQMKKLRSKRFQRLLKSYKFE